MIAASPYAEALGRIPVRAHEAAIAGTTTRWWEYGPADATRRPDAAPPATIVAVHGYRGDHHGLEPVVAQLPELRVLMPDLPGFGGSAAFAGRHTVEAYADWLIAFLAEVDPDGRATVLGHSFGSIVVAAALDRGLAPAGVVLVNPIAAPALAGPKGVLSRITLAYYRAAGAAPTAVGNALLSSPLIVRFMSVAMATTRDRALRRWIHAEHDRYFSEYASPTSVVEGFEASIGDHVHAHVAAIPPNTLLIGASADQITSLRDLHALHDAIPGSRLVVIDGVGHLIHYEKPAEAAEAIRRFLAADGQADVGRADVGSADGGPA